LRFFAPQGRHVAPIGVKFGTEEGTKFHPHRCNEKGVGSQKLKFLLDLDSKHESPSYFKTDLISRSGHTNTHTHIHTHTHTHTHTADRLLYTTWKRGLSSRCEIPRDAMLARYMLWLCVCLSFRLSVKSWYCVKMIRRRIARTNPRNRPGRLIFVLPKIVVKFDRSHSQNIRDGTGRDFRDPTRPVTCVCKRPVDRRKLTALDRRVQTGKNYNI